MTLADAIREKYGLFSPFGAELAAQTIDTDDTEKAGN